MVVENVLGCEAQDSDSSLSKPAITRSVVCGPICEIVCASIDLDTEMFRSAIGIQDVRPDRMLAAEAEPVQSAAPKTIPQNDFRQAHVTTERARSFESQDRRAHCFSATGLARLRRVAPKA
jgi:hypothetical protein